jgi:hypothetical protein
MRCNGATGISPQIGFAMSFLVLSNLIQYEYNKIVIKIATDFNNSLKLLTQH